MMLFISAETDRFATGKKTAVFYGTLIFVMVNFIQQLMHFYIQ